MVAVSPDFISQFAAPRCLACPVRCLVQHRGAGTAAPAWRWAPPPTSRPQPFPPPCHPPPPQFLYHHTLPLAQLTQPQASSTASKCPFPSAWGPTSHPPRVKGLHDSPPTNLDPDIPRGYPSASHLCNLPRRQDSTSLSTQGPSTPVSVLAALQVTAAWPHAYHPGRHSSASGHHCAEHQSSPNPWTSPTGKTGQVPDGATILPQTSPAPGHHSGPSLLPSH